MHQIIKYQKKYKNREREQDYHTEKDVNYAWISDQQQHKHLRQSWSDEHKVTWEQQADEKMK